MELWVIALLALALTAILILSIGMGHRKAERGSVPGRPPRAGGPPKGNREPCPLCGSALGAGEKVRSERFEAGNDSIVHLLGCPRCNPANGARPRICPVCRRALRPDDYVVGRMWDKRGTQIGRPRRHLHILGCTLCRPRAPGAK